MSIGFRNFEVMLIRMSVSRDNTQQSVDNQQIHNHGPANQIHGQRVSTYSQT